MRSYSPVVSPFDDGSQVEGIAFGLLGSASIWYATALAGLGPGGQGVTGPLVSNFGGNTLAVSTDDVTWTPTSGAGFPIAPSEVADVIWWDAGTLFFAAGWRDPGIFGPQTKGEWRNVSHTGISWTEFARATTATFECAVCMSAFSSRMVVGGELDSGSGRLIATGSAPNPVFTTRSTPIDNQPFRVSQIAYDQDFGVFVAALVPVGSVSVAERLMISTDNGVTWSMSSSPLDGTAAYGVAYTPNVPGVFATGIDSIVFSDGGDVSGSWSQFSAPAGVHTGGKPVDTPTNLVVPGGDTNDVSEFDYGSFTFASAKLPLLTAAKVAGYRPVDNPTGHPEVVLIGGLGSPTGALYASGISAIAIPSLTTHFDLG